MPLDPDAYTLDVCVSHRIWGNLPGGGLEKRTVSVSGLNGPIPANAVIHVFVAPDGYATPAAGPPPPPQVPPGASPPWKVDPSQQKSKNGNTVPPGCAIYIHLLSVNLGQGVTGAKGGIKVKVIDSP